MGGMKSMMKCSVAILVLSVAASLCAKDVSLVLPKAGERLVTTVDPAGDDTVTVRFSVPVVDVQQLWTPDLAQPFLGRKWWITKDSAPQSNLPYISYFNLAEQNLFSFGSASLEWDNRLNSKINQEKGVYEVALTVVAGPKGALRPFAVTLDRRAVVWTQALDDWRASLAYPKGVYPEAAWKPVFCSWYAVHAAVTQDWTERTAKIAADLGFGTFILDDGWSYDEMKRVNPETIKTWYRDVGDWSSFSKAKFPDFKAHRERMRALGLKYIVWVAPYFFGTRSEPFRRWGYDKMEDPGVFEGNALADVANDEMMRPVTDQLVTFLKETDLDGLKIDFLDYIKPSVDKPRGAASLAYIEDLMKRLRALKPDGVFEYRQSYATPITAHLATQFRAGDVPYEWLANLLRIAQIRLAMGSRVPVHADPIYWSDYETDENVDRHFMASMAGVPMLSMDLEKMPAARRRTVKAWTDYYRTRIEKFHRGGDWQVVFANGALVGLTCLLPDEAFVIVNDPVRARRLVKDVGNRKLTVFNLGFEPADLGNGLVLAPAAAFPACPGSAGSAPSASPKYVFLFIGDGMSLPQRTLAAEFRHATKGEPLAMNALPYQAMTTTHSADARITDSAAAATAIACGEKTRSGYLGVDAKGNRLESMAEVAKRRGRKIAIVTTTAVVDATPAGFFGHQKERKSFYRLGLDLLASGFDYFAAGGVYGKEDDRDDSLYRGCLYDLARQQGYQFCTNRTQWAAIRPGAKSWSVFGLDMLPYSIDGDEAVPALAELVEKGIAAVDGPDGFFLMCEGGMIDHAGHGNDAAANIHDTLAFDDAIKVALGFQDAHPDETLIVVTGDHETGGLSLGLQGNWNILHVGYLAKQKRSAERFSVDFRRRVADSGCKLTYGEAQALVTATFGLRFGGPQDDPLTVTPEEDARLKAAFEHDVDFVRRNVPETDNYCVRRHYAFAQLAMETLAAHARIAWGTDYHSALPTVTTAKGPGAEMLVDMHDNTDIGNRMKALLSR